MKKCDVCGKRAEGLGTVATLFENAVLCSNCYEGIQELQILRNKRFSNIESLQNVQNEARSKMIAKKFPEEVMQNMEQWFQKQQDDIHMAEKKQEALAMIDDFMMSSGFHFEGYRIVKYHGVISGESVLGTGFLSSWDASWSDTFGVESNAFIDKLKQARNAARTRAVEAAIETGGNAIIGVDIDYTMFTNNLIGVIFNGTSVTIEKNGNLK